MACFLLLWPNIYFQRFFGSLIYLVFEKMLTKLEEELKSCQKELDASKEISKKLMMERNMLEQKIQRLERAKAEEVFFFLLIINHFLFPVLNF
jgi:hypothetical protein